MIFFCIKKVIHSMQFSLNSSSSDLHSILYFHNQQFFPHIPHRCDSVGKKIYVVEHSDHWDRVNKQWESEYKKRKKIIFCSTRVNTSVIEHVYCLCGGWCVTRDRKKIYIFLKNMKKVFQCNSQTSEKVEHEKIENIGNDE